MDWIVVWTPNLFDNYYSTFVLAKEPTCYNAETRLQELKEKLGEDEFLHIYNLYR